MWPAPFSTTQVVLPIEYARWPAPTSEPSTLQIFRLSGSLILGCRLLENTQTPVDARGTRSEGRQADAAEQRFRRKRGCSLYRHRPCGEDRTCGDRCCANKNPAPACIAIVRHGTAPLFRWKRGRDARSESTAPARHANGLKAGIQGEESPGRGFALAHVYFVDLAMIDMFHLNARWAICYSPQRTG